MKRGSSKQSVTAIRVLLRLVHLHLGVFYFLIIRGAMDPVCKHSSCKSCGNYFVKNDGRENLNLAVSEGGF